MSERALSAFLLTGLGSGWRRGSRSVHITGLRLAVAGLEVSCFNKGQAFVLYAAPSEFERNGSQVFKVSIHLLQGLSSTFLSPQ